MVGMKKLLVIVCLEILVFSFCSIHKSNSNDNSVRVDNFGHGQIHNVQVRDFSEIPKGLLYNIDEMGKDNSSILNEYEGKYLNYIFNIDPQDFNLVGKQVGFITRGKTYYFKETQERFSRNSTTVGGSGLYIFNAEQKAESGGYDAAIVYWSKFSLPIEDVVKRLKKH